MGYISILLKDVLYIFLAFLSIEKILKIFTDRTDNKNSDIAEKLLVLVFCIFEIIVMISLIKTNFDKITIYLIIGIILVNAALAYKGLVGKSGKINGKVIWIYKSEKRIIVLSGYLILICLVLLFLNIEVQLSLVQNICLMTVSLSSGIIFITIEYMSDVVTKLKGND